MLSRKDGKGEWNMVILPQVCLSHTCLVGNKNRCNIILHPGGKKDHQATLFKPEVKKQFLSSGLMRQ